MHQKHPPANVAFSIRLFLSVGNSHCMSDSEKNENDSFAWLQKESPLFINQSFRFAGRSTLLYAGCWDVIDPDLSVHS